MDNAAEQPMDIKGRTYLEDGVWVYLMQADLHFCARVKDDDLKLMLQGQRVPIFNCLTVSAGNGKMGYLPSLMRTAEPWFISGAQCGVIALVHPVFAKELETRLKEALSVITTPDKTVVAAGAGDSLKGFRKL